MALEQDKALDFFFFFLKSCGKLSSMASLSYKSTNPTRTRTEIENHCELPFAI